MEGRPRKKKTTRNSYIPVVPFTTNVVTAGLTAETVTGVTRRTPPMGTVRRMVPGCPGAPFSTTWNTAETISNITHRLAGPHDAPLPGSSEHMWSAQILDWTVG